MLGALIGKISLQYFGKLLKFYSVSECQEDLRDHFKGNPIAILFLALSLHFWSVFCVAVFFFKHCIVLMYCTTFSMSQSNCILYFVTTDQKIV